MTRPISSRFSPRSLAPAQLERLLVGREATLYELQDLMTGAVASGQARFDLVIGPRGAGKSHLLGVLEGRLRASPRLRDRTVIVASPEQPHPLSLVQFLAWVLGELPDDPEVGPASEALRSLQAQRDGNQQQRAVDMIRARLDGRSLIIVVEELDELFTALGRDGQSRLRNVLQTERRWSIVASSRSLIPAFTKYEAPFHGTFNLHRLEPLTPEQCREMLAKLADAHGRDSLAASLRTAKGLARVRGLHHLLGGNPRAMAFLFRQLDERRLEHFEDALADLADELRPYVQGQWTRLSPTQRAIVELLAHSWRPLTVTEIAERSFITQSTTSGALRHLRRDALVQSLELGREHLYELADPLDRIARADGPPRGAIASFAGVVRGWYEDSAPPPVALRYVAADGAQASAAEERHGSRAYAGLRASKPALGDLVAAATASPDPADARQALLATLDGAASANARALSDRVIEAGVLGAWARAAAYGDLGRLLPRLRPSKGSPALALALGYAVESAWHRRRLPELLDPAASIDPLLATLPSASRSLLALASACSSSAALSWPGVEAAIVEWAQQPSCVGAGLALQIIASLDAVPGDQRESGRAIFAAGVLGWLASRRELEPIARLAERLEIDDAELAGILRAAGPREATARLSAPERALIRAILEAHDDRQGLAELLLDAGV